jgi:alpha/beta superfamily hydrolase
MPGGIAGPALRLVNFQKEKWNLPMEKKVSIPGPEVLEGRFAPGSLGPGVIITHPHPLFGGSMDNNVVRTAARAFGARSWATLRFNFRGVGESAGTYGEGLAEMADVAAALEFLKARTPGPCYVVGYSFGAFVAARAMLNGLEAAGAILISPPIAFMDLAFLPRVPGLGLIIAGDRDELCPLADLRELLAKGQAPVQLAVIAQADHFFGGREEELFRVLQDFPFSPDHEN